MDPDFYVIRRGWIDSVLSSMRDGELGFLGSVWNPRWYYQYRDFPSVHFMLIDLQRIAIEDIDFKPEISDDRWWQLINRHATPIPKALRETLKAQRCRDTGWRIYRRYRRDPAVRTDRLLPHYVPPEDRRYRWERKLGAVMPASWRKYPINRSSYTEESFLRESLPMAYELSWEEFFWRGAPFAVHLRRVGRPMVGTSIGEDLTLVDAFLTQMIGKQR